MEPCRQFVHLLNGVKKHTDDVKLPSDCFANGNIKGYRFRLFQEPNIDNKNGTNDKYCAYLCIKDEKTKGSLWSAFYNQYEIDEWVEKHHQ